ncbi:MAG: hypothetical protein IJS95_05585 [Prevotella sp.]|nr:hypothetical protein [Prevotella sp.]
MTYQTLEEIEKRKDELQTTIHAQGEQIGTLWHDLTAPQPSASKGEMIAHIVTNSITAIDGFLLVRKLIRNYGFLFGRRRRK